MCRRPSRGAKEGCRMLPEGLIRQGRSRCPAALPAAFLSFRGGMAQLIQGPLSPPDRLFFNTTTRLSTH